MSTFHLIYFIWVLLSASCFTLLGCASSWCPYQFLQHSNRKFEQKTDRFWEFSEQANRWVEVKLPYDLVSCVNSDCSKVGVIKNREESLEKEYEDQDEKEIVKNKIEDSNIRSEDVSDVVLPQRKRISLTKMSETSIWVTGESGSIYERFWNGLEWVIAPHDLPMAAANSVFVINQTILALSDRGNLYQMEVQVSEGMQPVWVDLTPTLNQITDIYTEQNPAILIKSGAVSRDGQRAYFCTKNGTLIELAGVEPPRWMNHGQPTGANVTAIADADSARAVVYTIRGDLYEYDRKSKPSWKMHIWQEGAGLVTPNLMPSKGCALHGSSSDHSMSLFLLTKAGILVERRLHQRKWKWVVHGSPQHQKLTSITLALQDESSETSVSLFFSTSAGSVFEYRLPKPGTAQNNQFGEAWISHLHPLHAKAARGIPGLQIQVGRMLFPLDDGRLVELHLLGHGGESSGPAMPQSFRRKTSTKYVWSIIDVPESEGWNAEYCTEERGPRNCISGIKEEMKDSGITSMTRNRKQSQAQHHYLAVDTSFGELIESAEEYKTSDYWIISNFRLRLMYEGKSFFLVSDGGLIFEYLCVENAWIWLRHESFTAMKGILGNYNGSLFMVDTYGSLLLRERSGNELAWKNCTALRKGRKIVAGQPWDVIPGKPRKVTTEDSLFFVSKNGRLLQFMVSMRKFKWRDCRKPPNTKVACILDQEIFRENIIFVIGRNSRLYQYNKVTDLWHEHYQSQHLILSHFPGTAIRPSSKSLSGSLFMLSSEGGLVEYYWNSWYGWNWVEHGTPYKGVTLVGSTGPCFEGNQLFLIGSDGKVYLRYMDKKAAWKWKDFGFPFIRNKVVEEHGQGEKAVCINEDSVSRSKDQDAFVDDLNPNCDPKVASTRPIPFSEGSVIFELRDGRLAELQLVEETKWIWSRIIGTPTSLCLENYWTTLAT